MSDQEPREGGKTPPKNTPPEMRRGVSRRSLITDELGKASFDALKRIPTLAPIFGFALRESPAERDERLVKYLWQLLMGREPKPEESAASLEVVHNARGAGEKADALVDILWALCQTTEFEELNRSNRVLVKGLYKIALDREPNEEESAASLAVLDEAIELPAKTAALEGLLSGLLRAPESVIRKETSRR